MKMRLNRTESPLYREERNKINRNWNEIEGKYNNAIDNISDEAFNKVIEGSKIDWSQVVNDVGSLPGNAKEGETRGVKSDNKIYRYDGKKWVPIAEINLNPITEVDNRLNQKIDDNYDETTQQLAETAKKIYVDDKDYEIQTMMKPVNITDGAITKLLNTGLTYIDRKNIVYGNDYTPFSDLKGTTGGKFEMDCSSFGQSMVTGTTYENCSWFNENNFYDESFFPLINYSRKRGRMLAHQQAKYCYDNGMLYEPKEDWSNVRVGDLVYFALNYDEGFWRNIGHNAIVSRIDQNGENVTVFEAIGGEESGCVETTYTIGQMNGSRRAYYCARLPLKDVETMPKLISRDNFSDNRELYSTVDLESNRMYTLFIKADLGDGVYPIIRVGGVNIYSFTSGVIKRPDKMYKVNFYIPRNIPKENYSRTITILLRNSNESTHIIFSALYDGYLTTCPLNVEENLKSIKQNSFSKSAEVEKGETSYINFSDEINQVLDEDNYYFISDTTISGSGGTTVLSSINEASRKSVVLFNGGGSKRNITVHYTLTQLLK